MSGWRRGASMVGTVLHAGLVLRGPLEGDWMASTAGMAGLAVVLAFWRRDEREARAIP